MNPQPKPKTLRNEDYLKFIRSLPCPYSGRTGNRLPGPERRISHHVRRSYWGAGGGQKPHDYVAVPRHTTCHSPQHEVEVEHEIIENLMLYIFKKHGPEGEELARREVIEVLIAYIESRRRK